VLLAAACGGGAKSNGLDKLSATDALAKVKAAAAKVTSVHVVGNVSQGPQQLSLDIEIGSDAADGTIGLGGGSMELRLVNGVTYFRGDSKVFAAFGASATQAGLAAGKWIKDTGSGGPAATFGAFLDKGKLFDALLAPQGTVKSGGSASVNGTKALILIDTSTSGGELFVAETGPALPLRIEKTGTGGGRIDFTDYGKDVSVDVPAGAIDISQLCG
jgi:hypothetical protein